MSNKPLVSERVLAALAGIIPTAASATTEALVAEIPAYGPDVRGPEDLEGVQQANELALRGFFAVVSRSGGDPAVTPGPQTIAAAYAFGQYEAQHDRDMNALLAAYRIGTRTAWQYLSDELIRQDVPGITIARFAALVFAYMDNLSAASIAGHTDELAASTRAHEQHRARLALVLLEGADPGELAELARLAGWHPPETITAAIVAAAHMRPALQQLDHRTLIIPGDLAPDIVDDRAVLLVPDAHRNRGAVAAAFGGRDAVLGPSRPWVAAHRSYRRARRALDLLGESDAHFVDTDDHLVELVVSADPEALADLRTRVLAPLAELRPATADRLVETLRVWLLRQGHRESIAAELDVHPQTVRYRMGQLRELFGEQLTTSRGILELTVALANEDPAQRE